MGKALIERKKEIDQAEKELLMMFWNGTLFNIFINDSTKNKHELMKFEHVFETGTKLTAISKKGLKFYIGRIQ